MAELGGFGNSGAGRPSGLLGLPAHRAGGVGRPECVILGASPHGATWAGVVDRLAGCLAEVVGVSVRELPGEATDADVLVLLVDPETFGHAIAAIVARRAGRNGGGVVLAVVRELSGERLLELVSAGVFDFEAAAALDAGSFLVRLKRALGAAPTELRAPDLATLPAALRELVGSSPEFAKQLAALPAIAGCDARVLILGETGTGKELYARAIHYNSARSSRQMVAVNCGAIPTELVESELFGHVRGAFSNAYAARAGLVREAEGGTLFLDEIDSLPLSAQVKLLRFLNDMEFRPVGADATHRANVRVIAASNRDLAALVETGRFRQDLFFRLRVLHVTLPPLRERRQDICALALHFAREFAHANRRPTLGFARHAMQRLLAYDWPGNVRELRHVIERATLLATSSAIQAEDLDLPDGLGVDDDAEESFRAAKARAVGQFERQYIERLLASCNGNVTHASRLAKKNRRAFFELMRRYQIRPERFRQAAGAATE
jgi:two-component system response regulator GlrR